jgi:ParB-like chromosome segregation protein Spo0J
MTLSFAPDAIETWPLAKLQPYAKNAKAHGADQVAKIAASMAEFGWTVPCLVADDGELIAGHGRVLAATQLGLTEAPVILLGHLTEAQRRAYRIADNKLAESPWDEALLSAELNELLAEDYDLSLVGFSDGELDKLLAYVPEGDGEDGAAGGSVPPVTIPEPPRNPASQTGDLWILGDHRLLCGDSTSAADVRRLMNGERAILFATDPPYLVDYDGSNHPTRNKDWSASYGTTWDDSSQGAELYDGFIAAAVAEAIAENAAWYCWHASRRQAMLEACWEKAGAFVHQQIIWVKDRGVLTRSHYLWKHEPCFMGWRRPNRPPKVAEETLPRHGHCPALPRTTGPTIRRRNRSTPSGSRCASMWRAAGFVTSRSVVRVRRSWRGRPMGGASSRWKSARPTSTSPSNAGRPTPAATRSLTAMAELLVRSEPSGWAKHQPRGPRLPNEVDGLSYVSWPPGSREDFTSRTLFLRPVLVTKTISSDPSSLTTYFSR